VGEEPSQGQREDGTAVASRASPGAGHGTARHGRRGGAAAAAEPRLGRWGPTGANPRRRDSPRARRGGSDDVGIRGPPAPPTPAFRPPPILSPDKFDHFEPFELLKVTAGKRFEGPRPVWSRLGAEGTTRASFLHGPLDASSCRVACPLPDVRRCFATPDNGHVSRYAGAGRRQARQKPGEGSCCCCERLHDGPRGGFFRQKMR